jgi:hypothetical protein
MSDRKAQKRRLERAGYVHLSGWVPAAYAAKVMQQVEMHRDDVERVVAEPAMPRGRPKRGFCPRAAPLSQ